MNSEGLTWVFAPPLPPRSAARLAHSRWGVGGGSGDIADPGAAPPSYAEDLEGSSECL